MQKNVFERTFWKVGITLSNLSILKKENKAVRFSTLEFNVVGLSTKTFRIYWWERQLSMTSISQQFTNLVSAHLRFAREFEEFCN
jgi:hypothetical protein